MDKKGKAMRTGYISNGLFDKRHDDMTYIKAHNSRLDMIFNLISIAAVTAMAAIYMLAM